MNNNTFQRGELCTISFWEIRLNYYLNLSVIETNDFRSKFCEINYKIILATLNIWETGQWRSITWHKEAINAGYILLRKLSQIHIFGLYFKEHL